MFFFLQIYFWKNGSYKFLTIAGLSFLWSKPEIKNVKEEEYASIVLEKADKEFDNGHYEDCYHILVKSKVNIQKSKCMNIHTF